MVFVNNATHIEPTAHEWPKDKMDVVANVYEEAIDNYTNKLGSLEQWANTFNVTPVDLESGHAGGAIRLVYRNANNARAAWNDLPIGRVPSINFGDSRKPVADMQQAYHELAHIWDGAHFDTLGKGMQTAMRVSGSVTDITNHGNFPTEYAKTDNREDFAESVTSYFLASGPDHYADYKDWSDDDPRYRDSAGNPVKPDTVWHPPDKMDRHDYIEQLFRGPDQNWEQ
jgi:hypothetical protein